MTEKQAYKILLNTPIRSQHNHTEYSKALHMAIGALGKQIPKEPHQEEFELCVTCPICGCFLECLPNYCEKCGQALLWEGDTDV